MSDIAIRVENLSKRYRIGKAIQHTDGSKPLLQRMTAPFHYLASTLREPDSDEIIWALKDVSFEACPERSRRIQRGEVVGIPSQARDRHRAQRGGQEHSCFGELSTSLKILSRITEPTSGRAIINGRVGSLLEACPE